MKREDVAYWGASAASLAAIAFLGPLARRIEMIGEDDLSRIWAGPRAVLIGHDPYDPAGWIATATALGTQLPDTRVFIYPPWVTVPLLPLALLPLPVASALWLVAGLAVALLATRVAASRLLPGRAVDHAVVAVALLLSWVGLLTLVIGQWGYFLVAALFTAILALERGRALAAGLAALAFLAKPQLFFLTAPAFAAHALWPRADGSLPRSGVRTILIAAAGAAILVAIGWIVLPSWWPTWLETIGAQQTRPFSDTMPGLVAALFGAAAAPLGWLVVAACAAAALAFHPRGDGWMPVWSALSLVGAPYTNSYDQILLIVPVVLASGALHARDRRRSRAVLWAGAAVLLLVTPLMYYVAVLRHSETFGGLVSLGVFAIVTGSLWPYRREAASLPA